MTKAELARFAKRLRELRAELLAQGPAKIEPNRRDDAAVGVNDEDAQALSEMLQAIASGRNREQAALVARIDGALRKLGADPEMFGLCEECEEEIPAKRLAAMPYAAYCAECQAARDPKRGPTRKKLTDYT